MRDLTNHAFTEITCIAVYSTFPGKKQPYFRYHSSACSYREDLVERLTLVPDYSALNSAHSKGSCTSPCVHYVLRVPSDPDKREAPGASLFSLLSQLSAHPEELSS